MTLYTYTDFEDLEIQYIGPQIHEGARLTVIYFSLCAEESLSLDPFNQPALALVDQGVRVFSITLPGHGKGFDKYQGMQYWADHLLELSTFIKKTHAFVDQLDEKKLLEGSIGTMGLSRGAFMATHLGSHQKVGAILGFAPVTDLGALSEFKGLDTEPLSYPSLYPELMKKKIRCYIGNRDERVHTQCAFDYISSLADFAYQKRIRSPTAELFIIPSVGQLGHGTLPPTFKEGASWLKKQIVE